MPIPAGSIPSLGMNSGPCEPWIPLCTSWPAGASPVITGAAVEAATEILWERTARRFGLCTVKLFPCREDNWPSNAARWLGSWLPTQGGSSGWGWPYPALLGGLWYNLGCGGSGCGGTCTCNVLWTAQLPQPVVNVIEVKVDGVVLDPTAYRVDNWRTLVRLDGKPWPVCNNINQDDTHVGTWSVTAQYGETVPVSGQLAVGELAQELVKSCLGGACQVPQATLTRLKRQGVERDFIKITGKLGEIIGLHHCDLFVQTYNPTASRPAAIYGFDGPRRRYINT